MVTSRTEWLPFPATKNDFELMFYDRKNIIPEYKIITSYHSDSLNLSLPGPTFGGDKIYKGIAASVYLTLENVGRRPVAINEINFEVSIFENPRDYDKIEFTSVNDYKKSNIIIHPNEIKNQIINFFNIDDHLLDNAASLVKKIMNHKQHIKTKFLRFRLSDGREIQSELIQTSY